MKVRVYHRAYGCETGCCGHVVEVKKDGGEWEGVGDFNFDHPYGEEPKKWAAELARQTLADEFGENHCADLMWEECEVLDD